MDRREPSSRHIVYNRAGFTLDVRLDAPGDGTTRLAGQLLERQGLPIPEVPVFLITGDRLLASTVTGRFGEFRLECESQEDLCVCLSLEDEELIEVKLSRFEPAEREGHDSRLLDLLLSAIPAPSREPRLAARDVLRPPGKTAA